MSFSCIDLQKLVFGLMISECRETTTMSNIDGLFVGVLRLLQDINLRIDDPGVLSALSTIVLKSSEFQHLDERI